MSSRASERGSATLLGVQLLALLALVTVACAGLAAVVTAHRRAQAAADLAALSGAAALQRSAAACPAAEEIASDNGARMMTCTISGETVTVLVELSTPPLLGRARHLRAQSRAGPVRSGSADPAARRP